MSISLCGPVNPSTPTFPNINFTKRMTKMLLQKSLKIGCNNLCFCHYAFNMVYKSFPQLTSLSRRGSVNPSTSTFGITNLTEAMTFNCCLEIQSKTAARVSFCTLKPLNLSLSLPSISCCRLVTPSTHTFPNISITKTMVSLLIVWKMTEKGLQ